MKTPKTSTYQTLDDLCRIFLDCNQTCFKNGKYIGNSFALWIAQNVDCFNTANTTKVYSLLQNIAKAKKEESAEADEFLHNLNMILHVAG